MPIKKTDGFNQTKIVTEMGSPCSVVVYINSLYSTHHRGHHIGTIYYYIII